MSEDREYIIEHIASMLREEEEKGEDMFMRVLCEAMGITWTPE